MSPTYWHGMWVVFRDGFINSLTSDAVTTNSVKIEARRKWFPCAVA